MKYRRQLSLFQMNRFFISPSLLLALVIGSFCFLGGCASNKGTASAFTPVAFESSKAAIYVYRKSRFVGAANTAEIFSNNHHAGQLVSGSYCTHITEPGRIEIKAAEKLPAVFVLVHIISKLAGKQPLIEFMAYPGREYFLEFNVAGYKVKQVSKDKALGIMNGLKLAKPRAE
ncbi:MAG: DUF2846 domain-containing protein [Deltaproteobacteria bacterium]|nr:DUF2846 domain-containing protein [Deltaproteobacteria bacterium]